MDLAERLMAKVSPEPNSGCWLWVGALDQGGYGKIGVKGRTLGAHRVAYALFKCEVPEGLDLDHLCRVRCCVNPDHLEPVTRRVNCKRGLSGAVAAQIKRSKTHCPQGHEYSPENVVRSRKGYRLCLSCKREARQRWYAQNRETQIEYLKQWRRRPENKNYDKRRRAEQALAQ